ncbi:MAG: septum formation initiator family protein [Alistipes sp.]|nr:septum formation initiator family protein [Alistipes sp.]
MQIEFGRRFWITTTVIIVLFTLFFVGRNLLHAIEIRYDIRELEREEEHYRTRIAADSTLVEQLQYDDYLEEYAREKFRMQRSDEKVYLIK